MEVFSQIKRHTKTRKSRFSYVVFTSFSTLKSTFGVKESFFAVEQLEKPYKPACKADFCYVKRSIYPPHRHTKIEKIAISYVIPARAWSKTQYVIPAGRGQRLNSVLKTSDLRLSPSVTAEEYTVIDILIGVGYPHGEFACGDSDLAV